MGASRLSEAGCRGALVGVLLVQLLACEREPRVSPWGPRKLPPLGAFVVEPDLERSIAAIETEAQATDLAITSRTRVQDRGGTSYEVIALGGRDKLGRATSAARVASPWGVVLAIGPHSENGDVRAATELMAALEAGPGRAVKLPADLNADGSLEIVLRAANSKLVVFSLEPQGARELLIDMPVAPRGVRLLANGYGFWGVEDLSSASGPVRPALESLATFEAGRFSARAVAAQAWHKAEAARRNRPEEGEDAARKCARLIERAWHQAQAGSEPATALAALDEEKPTPELVSPFNVAKSELRQRLGAPAAK